MQDKSLHLRLFSATTSPSESLTRIPDWLLISLISTDGTGSAVGVGSAVGSSVASADGTASTSPSSAFDGPHPLELSRSRIAVNTTATSSNPPPNISLCFRLLCRILSFFVILFFAIVFPCHRACPPVNPYEGSIPHTFSLIFYHHLVSLICLVFSSISEMIRF